MLVLAILSGCGGNGSGIATPTQPRVPSASAGGPYTGTAGTAVSFSAAASNDPSGLSLSYAWNFGDGGSASGVSPTHIYSAAGNYTVGLTVTNSAGKSASASTTATIAASPQPPVANAGGPYTGTAGSALTFTGAGSSDPKGEVLTLNWDFGDGSTGIGATPSHTYASAGTYSVKLTVTNTDKLSASAGTTATIGAAALPPVANAAGPYTGTTGVAVSFTGSGSSDPKGEPLSYSWDFGDGSTAAGGTPSHAYSTAGIYTVKLTVTNTDKLSATASTTATIAAAVLNLTAAFSPVSATVYEGSQQGFSLNVSGAGSTPLSYQWTTTGKVGSLVESGGSGQTGASFCSPSSQVTYKANASPALNALTPDTVKAQVFTGSGCSGAVSTSASAQVTVDPPVSATALPGLPTSQFSGTLLLPAGSKLTPDALTVLNSVTSTTPDPSGNFTIAQYTGEQIAIVLSPQGTPMMLGWLDPSHNTISAETTAEVYAYFAFGGPQMANTKDQATVRNSIQNSSSIAALTQAISSELAANPDALGQPNANVTSAVNTLFTSLSGIIPFAKSADAVIKPMDVNGTPSAGTAQSGIRLNAENPSSATLTNTFRRRAHAFVIHQADTIKGHDPVPNGAAVTDFDIDPTPGLTGGVTGAITDIFKAYFGQQPTAYGPVTTDPFSLPVAKGFDSSTYQVIVVGAGGSGATFPVPLTTDQDTIRKITAVNGFVQDALVPFVTNVVFAGTLPTQNQGPFGKALETNVNALVSGVAGVQSEITGGNYKQAFNDIVYGVGQTQFQNSVADSVQAAFSGYSEAAGNQLEAAVKDFNGLMNIAGAALQVFDTGVYSVQITGANRVDLWTVTALPTKIALSPINPQINGNGYVQLTAAIPSVEDTTGYSYQWTIAPSSGQGLIGNLSPNDGSGRQNLTTTFCSSSNVVIYDTTLAAVANLVNSGSAGADTVSVTAFTGGNCQTANQVTSTGTDTITTTPNPGAVVSPASGAINPGGTFALTGSYSDTTITPASFLWTLSPVGTSLGGTLSGSGSTGTNSFCSTSPNVTYTSTLTGTLATNNVDAVQAQAYSDSSCSTPIGTTGVAYVTTTSTPIFHVGPTVTIQPGQTVQVGGAFLVDMPNPPVTQSYLWSTSGNYGSISAPDGSGNQFCSTSSLVTYNATANPTLAQDVADTVSATPYTDKSCGHAAGLTGTATMNIEPPSGPFETPGNVTSVLQSGDGNFYATSTGPCGSAGQDTCDYISRVDPEGTVTILHTSEFNANYDLCAKNSYFGQCINDDGSNFNPLIEAADGNLYGTAQAGGAGGLGTVFQMKKDGTFNVLYTFQYVSGRLSSYAKRDPGSISPQSASRLQPELVCHSNCPPPPPAYSSLFGQYPGPLVEGADGNLYFGASTSGNYGDTIGGGIFIRLSPDTGSLAFLRRFVYQQSYGVFPDNGSRAVDPVYWGLTGTYCNGSSLAPSFLQASDGNFYGVMSACDVGPGAPIFERIFRLDANGNPSVLYDFPPGSADTPMTLIQGPNDTLFSTNYNGNFSLTLGGRFTQLNAPLPSTATQPGGAVPLALLGSDGNFYNTVGSYNSSYTASYSNFVQVAPTGNVTTLGLVTDSSPNASFTYSAGTPYIESSDGHLVGGAVGSYSGSTKTAPYVFNDVVAPALKGPVQLAFASASSPANQPVQLTWKVLNGFSLSAQQCHATVQNNATGAGIWTGPQVGTMVNGVYTGVASITPTRPGTYTYALTCGGKESGFATLNVQ